MKKLLIVFLVLLLLGGGGAAAWWFYLKPQDEAEAAPKEPVAKLSEIEIPAISIGVIRDGKAIRTIFIQIVVGFDDPADKEKAQRLMPRLVDGFVTELHALLARKFVEQQGYDRALLEKRLRKVAERKLGAGVIDMLSVRNIQTFDAK
jgi:flagellar protein FliL